jgi:hypothetical protein
VLKTCCTCQIEKGLDAFNKHPFAKFGVGSKCRDCAKAYNKAHYRENSEKYIAASREWRLENPDRARVLFNKSKKKSRAMDISKKLAENALRVDYIKRATPSWANKFFIAEAYHLAKVREKVVGGKWHVDHIIPLRGKNVCGLHVENNLQVIPASVNLKKHAKFSVKETDHV